VPSSYSPHTASRPDSSLLLYDHARWHDLSHARRTNTLIILYDWLNSARRSGGNEPNGHQETSMQQETSTEELPPKPRVLIIAELCHPHWASVPLLAYSLVSELSKRDDLEITLVSQVRSREVLQADPIAERVRLHFIDSEFIAIPIGRLSTMIRGGVQL